MKINVTKSFLPPREEFDKYIDQIWDKSWLTNQGPLVQQLEEKLKTKIGDPNVLFVGNGTIAIQLALKAMELKGEIITTPFSYCATTTSILWENLKPVFVDIRPTDLNIDPDKIEAAITPNSSAILATHVYGLPCDIEKIEAIASKHKLKVIYDAAHAFGASYKGQSMLKYGDVSTCSFHATKVFHTVEGGAVICKDPELFEKVKIMRSFGHVLDDYYYAGINGKNSEFHAAMGLANLPHLPAIFEGRKQVCEWYDKNLNFNKIQKPYTTSPDYEPNYAYYPIVVESENVLFHIMNELKTKNIFPRRYFYPTLNQLKFIENPESCPVSEDISLRIMALPLYYDLDKSIVDQIVKKC